MSEEQLEATVGTMVASVDLGSNSFHMLVARTVDGQFHVVDRLREMVRLAAGLDEKNNLSADAAQRALDCLERFGQRLRDMPPGSVRIVGTNTLRKARSTAGFLEAAQSALGHPIEIISGREEARLIYLGVSHSLPDAGGRRLVIDIGGGSTEVIIGEGFEPQQMESLYMGCVSFSQRFFGDGAISAKAMRAAVLAGRMELEPVAAEYRRLGWSSAVGASGTVRAVGSVVRQAGWCREGISREALEKLREAVVEAGHVDKLDLPGLSEERRPVFVGGVAVLSALFEDLGIEQMTVSDWALREGLIFDLIGRIRHEDVRERTIGALSQRYLVDAGQARRVAETAQGALARVAAAWGMTGEEPEQLLGWAAQLHEIGLAIAHSGYHKHGAYLVEHSDLPGFSTREQRRLAALVRGHRRKFPQGVFKGFPKAEAELLSRLCLLLRLSVLLQRSRVDAPLPAFEVQPQKQGVALQFPEGWLEAHPLTQADLGLEAEYLRAAGLKLEFA